MKDTPQSPSPALSRKMTVSEVPPEGVEMEIVATEAERAALAQLNGLPAVLSLQAELRARRWRGDGLEIDGALRARVRQTCVASLDEFESDIAEPIHVRFAPHRDEPRSRRRAAEAGREAGTGDHDPLGEDPPDELVGGEADLGAVVSEFLTLALDPYPRRPGAVFDAASADAADNVSPFAALKSVVKQTPQK